MRRLPALPLVCALLAATACGVDEDGGGGSAAGQPAAAGTPAPSGCERVAQPPLERSRSLKAPGEELDPRKTYVATVRTSCGSFEITLAAEDAPRTGGSFAYLAERRFYDGLTFHRISRGFVIQGGDPQGDGRGGPGYSVVEAPPASTTYTRGTVAMAKTQTDDPGTSGSQFFVVTAEDARLDPDYALVGRVTRGQDVVDRIGVQRADPSSERPLRPVLIRSIRVTTR